MAADARWIRCGTGLLVLTLALPAAALSGRLSGFEDPRHVGAPIAAGGPQLQAPQRENVALLRAKANTVPAALLICWPQDERTPQEDRWSDDATQLLEEVGHTVTLTHSTDAFLAALRAGEYKVLLINGVEETRAMLSEIEARAPESVVLPILFTPTRAERRAAEDEFGRSVGLPTALDRFLEAISEAARAGQ